MSQTTENKHIDLDDVLSHNPRRYLTVSEAKAILSIARGKNLIDIESETGVKINQLQKWYRTPHFYKLLERARTTLYIAMTNTVYEASVEAIDVLRDMSLGRNGESKSIQIKALKILIYTSLKIRGLDLDDELNLLKEELDIVVKELIKLSEEY